MATSSRLKSSVENTTRSTVRCSIGAAPCFDHVCFTTGDVAGTWNRAVEHGVEPLSEPTFYPEYDSTIAWLYDADGTHIELMSELPPEILADAHATGLCSNHWVDDWQRSPSVTARSASGRVEVRR